MAENAIALGSEFKRVRDTFPVTGHHRDVGAPTSSAPDHTKRPGWHEWIKKNTAWSHQQVNSFIRVADKFRGRYLPANVSHSLLEFLARDHVPEEAREEVLARLDEGEKIGRGQAQEIVREKLHKSKHATDEADEDAGPDGDQEAEPEEVVNERAVVTRRLVLASIEMEGSILQTITRAQSALIASKLDEIAHVLSEASFLIFYHLRTERLAEIKSAADANGKEPRVND